jgi:hypothetical protein
MGKNKKNKCYFRRQERFIENMRITGSKSNQELKAFKERKNFRKINQSRANRRFIRESTFWIRAMVNDASKTTLIDAKNKERQERYEKAAIRSSGSNNFKIY